MFPFHSLPSSSIPSLTPGHQESVLHFYHLAISRMYANGIITVCHLWGLTLFSQHNVLEIPVNCCMYQ